MKTKSTIAIVTVGAYLTVPLLSYADCYSVYTNATAACSTAQNNTDNAAYNTYIAACQNAQNAYNTTINQDAIAQVLAQQICLTTLYTFTGDPQVFNDYGSCGSALTAADQAADDAYYQAVTSCGTNSQCLCRAVTTRDYSKAFAADVAAKCGNDAYNVYSQCVANSTAVQNQSDRSANAVFINSSGVAYATYERTVITSDDYTAPVCNQQAATANANCWLGVDKQQNPQNTCPDNCAIAQNNAYLAAYVAYMNSTGPAYAQYYYDNIMCGVTQSHDDQVSYAQAEYTIEVAYATYVYNQMLASILCQYTVSIDASQHDRDVNLCACNSTDDSQYNSCVATANATQIANDKNALAAYNQKAATPPSNPTGDNWNTWNQAVTTANNALQAAYAAHLLTEKTCLQNTQNSYDAVCNSAGTAYNNARYAADQAYQSCLRGCNQE